MKLIKIQSGEHIIIDTTKINNECKRDLKALFSMYESLSDEMEVIAIDPTLKGHNISSSKEIGMMGNKVEIPRRAIKKYDMPSECPMRVKPKEVDAKDISFKSEPVDTKVINIPPNDGHKDEVIVNPGEDESEDYDAQLFKQRMETIKKAL